MIQTKYEQQNLLESSLSIIDTLVSQAAKTEIGSIAAAYLIQANQEINLLELQYSGESTIQQQLYRVKIAFIKINQLVLNNLAVSYFRDYTQVEEELERFHRLIGEVKHG
ncbi:MULTISPECIES: hypothetical protein [Lactobacillaceae]|jgi:PIN domain nuclease of toxin-antitoxin system|uniref:Uncharacterized protein n=1 Tax=Loigolactobacillus coryniformis subsp. torquens DSM 20004 = KCTC 3535 TaxID=1423822 RepID=A0A2D1KLI9_9LACO|nr:MULTISPECIES: hypothetical protein [Lactobacillaceae]ATO43035.1 hypothetical protein LC20004_03555 [Loigolactobacillus coryniformis subsp. torquens DSM 20004 = KCTC 3535]KRK84169.1 hypothetical protein FC16_GL001653 [Loigolactobacillus coryniformis subsp. torquens DSM 20004 = KCTC 3535]